MTKIAGSGPASASGSISQRHGSADPYPDPDPSQNVMDPQHCYLSLISVYNSVPTLPYRTIKLPVPILTGKYKQSSAQSLLFNSVLRIRIRITNLEKLDPDPH
jgi:hypothetical protein